MTDSIRVALCQLNGKVGGLSDNRVAIVDAQRSAVASGARVAVFPELALSGFPPRDLLLRREFIDACSDHLDALARDLDPGCITVVGVPLPGNPDGDATGETVLHDAVAVIRDGLVEVVSCKATLSTQGPLEDHRYFAPGPSASFVVDGVTVAIAVGDEVMSSAFVGSARAASAGLILNPRASNFFIGGAGERTRSVVAAADALGCPVVMVNGVGGQDELVFDGGSFVATSGGGIIANSARFRESVRTVAVPLGTNGDLPAPDEEAGEVSGPAEIWAAIGLGLADYVSKNGFNGVGLGLSGGVDSALVAALAVDVLGPDRVHCVLMPSRHSSPGSITDATELASNLGVEARTIPIEPAHRAFEEMLAPSFSGLEPDLTEENLQARARGTTLMALSNKFGWLILTTGNRSEAAVGYSTLYGDSAGGLAPIMDIDKSTVYALCDWYNERCASTGSTATIPRAILTKAPSAELRPGQRDDQSLPPYEVLDPLLASYIDGGMSREQLVASGFDRDVVEHVTRLVDRAEYKRRQAPPGLVMTRPGPCSRRVMPMTRSSF